MGDKVIAWIASNLEKAYQLIEHLAVVLCLACFLLLFTPQPWLSQLHVAQMAARYEEWLGFVFILSMLVNALRLIRCLVRCVKQRTNLSRVEKQATRLLDDLDPDQKHILNLIIKSGHNAMYLQETPALAELVYRGILERVPDSRMSILHMPAQPAALVSICPELRPYVRNYIKLAPL